MKNKLQAAALIVLTSLVILAAAHSHEQVREKCTQEWFGVHALHQQQLAVELSCAPPKR